MTRLRRGREPQRGVALVTTLAIMVVVSMLVLGSVLTTQIELAVTRSDIAIAQAQYVAQAGLQTQKAQLFQTYQWLLSHDNAAADPCASTLDLGIDFRRDGSPAQWDGNVIRIPWVEAVGADHPNAVTSAATGELVGFYDVELIRFPDRANIIVVRSTGFAGNTRANARATSTATATYILSTGSTLETAIFAGAGHGGNSINGNAEIYGGVYIEGDETKNDDVVFPASGTFRMFNGYDAESLLKGNYNPADLMRNPKVDNLCASLRVAYGRVEIGNSVELGKPDNQIYAVAVGQPSDDRESNVEFRGSITEDTCTENRGVCSLQGVTTFDLDEVPRFPRLNEPAGNSTLCPQNSWRECLIDESEANFIAGDLSVGVCQALADAATAPDRTLRFQESDVDCLDNAGRGFNYTYNSATNKGTLTLYGNVRLQGFNVRFDETVEYSVKPDVFEEGILTTNANLFVERSLEGEGGNVRIEEDFVPAGGAKYPDVVVAIVAENNVTLNGGSGKTVTAPVYAGELFGIRANTTLIGQVIANEFCSMGQASRGGPRTDPDELTCNTNGAPPTIIFSSAGDNRPAAFRAVAAQGGTPTYALLSYEMR